jgi:hypothetical protein
LSAFIDHKLFSYEKSRAERRPLASKKLLSRLACRGEIGYPSQVILPACTPVMIIAVVLAEGGNRFGLAETT